MDAVDPDLVDGIEDVLSGTAGVSGVSDVRVRWIGHTLHAEAEIVVEPTTSLSDAHTIAHLAEHELVHRIHRLRTAIVHVGPDEPDPAAHQIVGHHRGEG